jgi:heme/copper-type cytochrome/quinol oxidase subunit 3
MHLLTSRDHALRIAVWTIIASEALMFAVLLAVHGQPVLAATPLALVLAVAITGALLAGGAGLASALRRTRDGHPEIAAKILSFVGVLGIGGLVLELVSARLSLAADPLGVVIIGLHAAHVAAGVALTTWVLALVRLGRVHRRHHDLLGLVATYWYFIAAVWVFVWPVVAARP